MLYTDEKAHAVSLYLSKTTFPESKSSYIRSFEKKMMTMKDSTIRYAGLAVIASFAVVEFILGVVAATRASVESPPLYVALALSIITIAAVILLVVFNNRPSSTHIVSKLWFHVTVLTVLTQLWFPLTALLTTHATLSCRYGPGYRPGQRPGHRWNPQQCDLPIAGSVFAYLITAVVMGLAVFVALKGQKLGFKVNVADADALGPIYLDREQEGEAEEREGLLATQAK